MTALENYTKNTNSSISKEKPLIAIAGNKR